MPRNSRYNRQSIRTQAVDTTDKDRPECQPHRHYLGEYRPSIATMALNMAVPSKLVNVAPRIETVAIPVCRQCYYVASLLAMLLGKPTTVIAPGKRPDIEPRITKLDA